MEELKDRLGGKCAACGRTEELQFDHIVPETKKYVISRIWSRPELLDEELSKCQLLCKFCHKKKTLHDIYYGDVRPHGYAKYRKEKCRCLECKAAEKEARKKWSR